VPRRAPKQVTERERECGSLGDDTHCEREVTFAVSVRPSEMPPVDVSRCSTTRPTTDFFTPNRSRFFMRCGSYDRRTRSPARCGVPRACRRTCRCCRPRPCTKPQSTTTTNTESAKNKVRRARPAAGATHPVVAGPCKRRPRVRERRYAPRSGPGRGRGWRDRVYQEVTCSPSRAHQRQRRTPKIHGKNSTLGERLAARDQSKWSG